MRENYQRVLQEIERLGNNLDKSTEENYSDSILSIKNGVKGLMEEVAELQKSNFRSLQESHDLQKELRKNTQYLQSIYNHIDVAIFVMDISPDEEFVFVGLNPFHERLTGLRSRLVKGKTPHQFLPEDIADTVTNNYRKCYERQSIVEYEEMLVFEGRETWWSTRLIPVFDEGGSIWRIIGASLHITDLKDAELQAQQEKRFIQTVIDTIPDPLFYKNAELRYTGCNKAFEKLTGIVDQDILNKTVFDIATPKLAEEYNKRDWELLENPPRQKYQGEVFTASGKKQEVVFHKAVSYDEKNRINGIVGVLHDISEQKEYQDKLKELSIRDGLTGVYNRRGFDELSRRQIKSMVRNQEPLSLLMIDIDQFKKYNDHYGHQEGDDCLRQVSSTIESSCLRPLDIVARYGGEEFIVLLPKTTLENARIISNRIHDEIRRLGIDHQNADHKIVTVSMGITSAILRNASEIQAMITRADQLLYQAKKSGRNQSISGDFISIPG